MSKMLANLDMNKNQLLNAVLQNLASAPGTPVKGQAYFNTTSNRAETWNGTAWVEMGSEGAALTDGSVTNAKLADAPTASIKGRVAAGTGAPTDLTAAEVRTLLNVENGATADMTGAEIRTALGITTLSGNNTGDQNAAAVSITDAGGIITATNVEAALQEIKTAVDLNTAKVTNANHTGDVTGDTALTITNKAVTLAKMADVATGTVFYRKTAATGVPEVQTLATLKTDLGLTGTNSGDQNAAGITIADAGSLITATTVEGALQENRTAINLNTAARHTQNSDTGTSSATFMIGTGGPKVKNSSGEVQMRNNADNAYADLRVNNLIVEGTTTTVNSNQVDIGDSNILLNADITTNAANSDGGITVKRLMADNTTRKDAVLNFNNSTGKWDVTQGAVTGTLITTQVASKVVAAVGNGVLTACPVTHNLNTRDVSVTVRETNSPYEVVLADVACTDLNTVTVSFAVAPTASQYTVTIIG